MTDRNPIPPRRIGLDLDNTIIDYEALIRGELVAAGLIADAPPGDKRALRDALRALPNGEEQWIRVQARIYGPLLRGASPFSGVVSFVRRAREAGISLAIVSHKTPFAEADPEGFDLRSAAEGWLEEHGIVGPAGIAPENVFFESTREEKIARIAALGLEAFVDDLVEVFAEPAFPAGVGRWLFCPTGEPAEAGTDLVFPSWEAIARYVFGRR